MGNVATGLSNLKTKVDSLNVDKLKTVLIDLKKLSDVLNKEVLKKTVYNKLNKEINNLEDKIHDANSLILVDRYNTEKQNLEKKNWRCW